MTTQAHTEQWYAVRSKGIGGSEITSVLGLNPYQTPYALWEVKTGRGGSFDGNKFTVAGNYLEPVVAQMFADQTGYKLYGGGEEHFCHPVHTFCIGTPDRFVAQKNGDAVLEIKTTQKTPQKEDIPLNWYFQNIWYQGITGKKRGFIAWLSRGVDFDFVEVEFNAEIFEEMVEQAAIFWKENVLKGVPPAPINKDDILRRLNLCPWGVWDMEDEDVRILRLLKEVKAKIKELEKEADEYGEHLALKMQGAELAVFQGLTLATWKAQKTTRLDTTRIKEEKPDFFTEYSKETETRVFRIR